jgi:hypothetical protein
MSNALHDVYAAVLRDRLPEVGMEIYELLFLVGRPMVDVCDWTGLPVPTVVAWRDRILSELREIELQLETVDVRCERDCAVAF